MGTDYLFPIRVKALSYIIGKACSKLHKIKLKHNQNWTMSPGGTTCPYEKADCVKNLTKDILFPQMAFESTEVYSTFSVMRGWLH